MGLGHIRLFPRSLQRAVIDSTGISDHGLSDIFFHYTSLFLFLKEL